MYCTGRYSIKWPWGKNWQFQGCGLLWKFRKNKIPLTENKVGTLKFKVYSFTSFVAFFSRCSYSCTRGQVVILLSQDDSDPNRRPGKYLHCLQDEFKSKPYLARQISILLFDLSLPTFYFGLNWIEFGVWCLCIHT